MFAPELRIEHRYQNRQLRLIRLKPKFERIIIGASPTADIRLLGQGVGGVHACLELKDAVWYLYDLGTEMGTLVNNKPIVEIKIEKPTLVVIGGHHLLLNPVIRHVELFKYIPNSKGERGDHQQSVIFYKNHVMHTELTPLGENFKFKIGKEEINLTPINTTDWETKELGHITVKRRLVVRPKELDRPGFTFPEELRKPILGALVIFAISVPTFVFLGSQTREDSKVEVAAIQSSDFAKMILDANVVKAQRKEALKITMTSKMTRGLGGNSDHAAKGMGDGTGTGDVQGSAGTGPAKGGYGAATKVISKIKASGLSAMIGRIAMRASNKADFIYNTGGSTTGGKASSRSVASIGGGTVDGMGTASVGVASGTGSGTGGYRIGGVGTGGKGGGGGGGSYREGTGLAKGQVGNASVGFIEQETIVDGGLSREVIAGVIREQLGQIRYCYERQLSANPDLYGKIQVKFTIGPTGTVDAQQIGDSTLKNANVEGCILRQIARWKFPEPKGGTSVLVTYPFLFKSSN